jgi:hypothetical protein
VKALIVANDFLETQIDELRVSDRRFGLGKYRESNSMAGDTQARPLEGS